MADINEIHRFVINGVEYSSLDEVPEEHRQVIRDAMKTAEVAGAGVHHNVSISVNGQDFSNLVDLSESQRAIIAQVLADRDGDGVPDIIASIAPMQQAIVRDVMADRDGDGIPDIMQGGPTEAPRSPQPASPPEPQQAADDTYALGAVVGDDPHLGRGAWIALAVVVAVTVAIVIDQML